MSVDTADTKSKVGCGALDAARLQMAFGRLPGVRVGDRWYSGGPFPDHPALPFPPMVEFLDHYGEWVREQLDAKKQAEDELVQIKEDLAGAGRVFLRAVGLGADKVSFDPVSGVAANPEK